MLYVIPATTRKLDSLSMRGTTRTNTAALPAVCRKTLCVRVVAVPLDPNGEPPPCLTVIPSIPDRSLFDSLDHAWRMLTPTRACLIMSASMLKKTLAIYGQQLSLIA